LIAWKSNTSSSSQATLSLLNPRIHGVLESSNPAIKRTRSEVENSIQRQSTGSPKKSIHIFFSVILQNEQYSTVFEFANMDTAGSPFVKETHLEKFRNAFGSTVNPGRIDMRASPIHKFRRSQSDAYVQRKRRKPHDERREIRAPPWFHKNRFRRHDPDAGRLWSSKSREQERRDENRS
jgi:hypothetical protein